MTWALKESLTPITGNGSSATVTPSAVPAAGDLVVLYVNRNGTGTISADSGGAAFISRMNEIPSGETARHALYTKVANGSEPSSYGLTFGSSDHYQVLMKVFSSSTPAVVDAAANTAITGTNSTNMVISAINGEVISDNALSLVFGGKDNRFTGNTYNSADNSYIGPIGKSDNEAAAGAYRIYTTGETFSGSVTIANSGSAPNDKTYGVHISFIEGSSGTTVPVGLVTSSESALTLGIATKAKEVGLASTTALAFSVTVNPDKLIEVGLATSPESVFSFGTTLKDKEVGLSSTTESAWTITGNKDYPVGLSTVEVGLAHPLSHSFARSVGLASEVDTTFPVLGAAYLTVGLATEIDSAITPDALYKTRSLGLPIESDIAQTLGTATKIKEVGLATEYDIAYKLVPPVPVSTIVGSNLTLSISLGLHL